MIITTTQSVEGRTVTEYLGIVSAIYPAIFPGGAKLMNQAQDNVIGLLTEHLAAKANALGADAVIATRLHSSGANQFLTGTAVKF